MEEITGNNKIEATNKITSNAQTEVDEDDTKFINELRKQYEDENLMVNNPLEMKIIHYLKLPNLAKIEIIQLKAIIERKDTLEHLNIFEKKKENKEAEITN